MAITIGAKAMLNTRRHSFLLQDVRPNHPLAAPCLVLGVSLFMLFLFICFLLWKVMGFTSERSTF